MNFTLDASGAQQAGQGIGNMFKAFVLGPQIRQQAEQDAALRGAKMGQAQATARYANARAGLDENQLAAQQNPLQSVMMQLGLPTDNAPAIRSKLATGSFGPSYAVPAVDGVGPQQPPPATEDQMAKLGQAMSLLQRITGSGSNVQQGAEAGLKEQQMRQIEQIIKDPSMAGTIGTAQAAAGGRALFNPTGNTGQSTQNFTGASGPINDVLAKLFSASEGALTDQRNASAGASRASAGLSGAKQARTEGGFDKPQDILDVLTGKTNVTRFPTRGDSVSFGEAPPKGTGLDATNAKARNAVIAAVEKELGQGYSDKEIMAEVDKRMARRTGDKSPAPRPDSAKIVDAPMNVAKRTVGTTYNTPKGPLTWNGKGWIKP
jgi:hypothetical protein